LSLFNASPLFEGIQDVNLTVPQIGGIETAVSQNSPNLTDIETQVDEAVGRIEFPDVPSLSDIGGEVDTALTTANVPSLGDVTRSVRTELVGLERTLGLPSLPSESDLASLVDSAESGVSDLTTAVDTTVDSTIDTADNAFESVQSNLQDSFDTATETITGEVQTAVDTLDEIQGNVSDFDGVTLPDIDSTIDGLLEDAETIDAAIDSRVSDVEQSLGLTEDSPSTASQLGLPTLSDITESVIAEIEAQIIPEADDVLLTDDVPRFLTITIEDFLQQTLSAETKQRLQEQG
jgi:hypothetical protein